MASIPVNSSHREKLKNTTELQFHQGVSRELRFHFLKPFLGGHVQYPGDPQCGCMALKRPGCTLLPASFRADADACESDDAESRPMTASGIQSSSCATEIPVRSSISASTCCGALRSFTRPCAACRPFFASFPRPCRTHSYGLPSDQIPSNSPTSPANHCSIMAGSDEKSATGGEGDESVPMAAWSTAVSWRVGTGARHRAQIRRVFWWTTWQTRDIAPSSFETA